jgi:hypothetical protein
MKRSPAPNVTVIGLAANNRPVAVSIQHDPLKRAIRVLFASIRVSLADYPFVANRDSTFKLTFGASARSRVSGRTCLGSFEIFANAREEEAEKPREEKAEAQGRRD